MPRKSRFLKKAGIVSLAFVGLLALAVGAGVFSEPVDPDLSLSDSETDAAILALLQAKLRENTGARTCWLGMSDSTIPRRVSGRSGSIWERFRLNRSFIIEDDKATDEEIEECARKAALLLTRFPEPSGRDGVIAQSFEKKLAFRYLDGTELLVLERRSTP